ncbi:MAG: hypothetical protein ACI8WB_001734 [Phenylobacterium sp.]|jgi:hypothetical protein
MTDANPQHPIDYSNDIISNAELTLRKRQTIAAAAGDSQSLQGTIADTAQISLLTLGHLLVQLKAGKPIDEIIASDPAFALCIEYAQAQAAGTMKLPFAEKPAGESLKDIIYRTNAVGEFIANG